MRTYLLVICLIIKSFSVGAAGIFFVEKDSTAGIFSKSTDNKDLSKITTTTYLEDMTPVNNRWSVKAGGYISTDLFWDTRAVVESRDGVLCLYPENVQKDIKGKDVNARPSFNFLALNTRVSLRITAPDVLGAKISGMVEGWFAGMSNNDMNGFSMRHAFIKMGWGGGEFGSSSVLIMGQTWHPLFTENCFAQTIAGSAGSPFQPFSRAPQIRFEQKIGPTKLKLYINSQRDFLSSGSAGTSSAYLRNSAIPESGIQYSFGRYYRLHEEFYRFQIGFGYDYKYLIPRITTDSNLYTRNGVHSQAAIVFLHFYQDYFAEALWGIKAKAMYARGCNEFLTLGGFAYRFLDNDNLNTEKNYQYTTLNSISTWIDIYRNIGLWEIGLFGGYAKNLGSQQTIQDPNNPNAYFARGRDIDYLYRVSFRVKYTVEKIQFGIEPEYTAAVYSNIVNEYGIPQKKSDLFPDAKRNYVGNLRILLNATLYF
ncbi:MAG: hypothetical protein FWH36_00790 [Lentimicrobiaceae bacterium]|nr:hypothetical protein [Lentimicrobiaceae bacterium]